MNWEFGSYRYFGLLLVLLMAAYLLWDFSKWRKKKRDFFAESRFQKHIFGEKSRFSGVLVLCYVMSFLLLILSFVDIVKNEKTEMSAEKASSDVIFLVDISNSMNSNDIEPSRLEQAKLILNKTLNQLGEERVGIVVFAGEARTMMPLTTDYSSVDIYLENLSSDLIKRQGTDFLLAMEETEKKIEERLENWDLDRISLMDKIILATAISELDYFPLTPARIIINEYIEIAKAFATDKSQIFVNGILDRYIKSNNRN